MAPTHSDKPRQRDGTMMPLHRIRHVPTLLLIVVFSLFAASSVPTGMPAAIAQEDAGAPGAPGWAGPETADEPPAKEIITGPTVFFGCAIGAAGGVVATALPPIANWAMMAGALPGVAALLLTAGIGCSAGVVGGVVVATVAWTWTRLGEMWSGEA